MARMIDASRFGEILEQWKKDCLEDNDIQGADIILDVILQLDDMPTLTQPNEWVSVEKRLPEDDAPAGRKQITVMVTTKAGKVTIASRVFEPERDYCGKVYPARWLWSRWLNNHVTHWMPLPEPPYRRPPEGEEET